MRHSVYTLQPISSVFLYIFTKLGLYLVILQYLCFLICPSESYCFPHTFRIYCCYSSCVSCLKPTLYVKHTYYLNKNVQL